jgi:hypothetical protein
MYGSRHDRNITDVNSRRETRYSSYAINSSSQQGCQQQQRRQKQDGSQHLTNIGKNYQKTLQNGRKFVKKADKTTKRVKFALVNPIDFSQADSY